MQERTKDPGERAFSGLQNRLDAMFARLAVWSVRHARWVLGGALALLIGGLVIASGVRQDNSLDSYFDEADPSYANYRKYIEEFSSDEVVYLLYSAPEREHGPFDLQVMRQIAQLTQALERELPFVRKVTSLANVEFIEADGDLITIHALMENFPSSQSELLRLREVALGKPLYVGSIVSRDAGHAAIVVEMTRTSTDPIERLRLDPRGGDALDNLYPQVPDRKVREILARPEYRGIAFKISGDVPMNAAYNTLLGEDIATMTLLTLLLAGATCVLFLGVRPSGLIAPLAVVILSLVLTVAFIGVMGWKINLFFLMVPTLICAVGIAQVVHMLLAWQETRALEPDRVEAVRRTILKIGTPCLLVVVTDAIGFLGMGVSHLRGLAEMAWYAAFGVMMTFVLSLTLLIALTARSRDAIQPPAPTLLVRWLRRAMVHLAAFNIRHSRMLLLGFASVLAVSGAGIARLKIDFNFLHEFKPHIEWRQHTQYINDVMGGLLSVVYLFDTGAADGIKDPALLKQIEALQEVAERQHVAQDSVSVADIVKELNQAFHGGDRAFYQLPEDREMLAQLLLVYEMSGGKEMNDVLNLDRSKTALQVRLKLVAASEVRRFMQAMDEHLARHPLANAKVEVSGIGLLWVRMADYISDSQLQGYALTFALIAVTMMLAFGSIRLGLLAMVPNLFPIALVLGCMGWLGWTLDYLRLLLATIAIGIAVDDTIHFVACYKREFEHCGRYREALERALPQVGPAMISMTVILIVAFCAYYASSMAVLSSFGFLLSVTIGAAAISDLFLMPALLLWLKPFGRERMVEEPALA